MIAPNSFLTPSTISQRIERYRKSGQTFCKKEIDKEGDTDFFCEVHCSLPATGNRQILRKRVVVFFNVVLLEGFRPFEVPGTGPCRPMKNVYNDTAQKENDNEDFVGDIEVFADGCDGGHDDGWREL